MRLCVSAIDSSFILMDDDASPHRTNLVDENLEVDGITRMKWLSYSANSFQKKTFM